MYTEKKGYICIVDFIKNFSIHPTGENSKEKKRIIKFLSNLFSFLSKNNFYFYCMDKNKVIEKLERLSEYELEKIFLGAPNDCDNYFWILAMRDSFALNSSSLSSCSYLDCFIDDTIAIFTQYDSDGIELQVGKNSYNLCLLILKYFENEKTKEGY